MSFARHFCRSCLATKESSSKAFTAEQFTLRSPEEHDKMCSEVASDTTQQKSKEYGINERSILNDVKYFSVIGGLCHDVFHDLLEGAVLYEYQLLLDHIFAKKYLTLNQFNERVRSFGYGYTETGNKPSNDLSIRSFTAEKLKIRYSATEMLLMARIIPFLVGDKIPENDLKYNCFLNLLKILQISLASFVSSDVAAYLRVLIEEHHIAFTTLYPNESFIPKQHYMLHYPNQILTHGPLIRSWTMRFEGKLKYFKGIAQRGNFKNVSLSLAKRHQRWLSYQLYSENFFIHEVTRGPIIQSILIKDECDSAQLARHLFSQHSIYVAEDDMCLSLRWVLVNGIKYAQEDCYLITNVEDDGTPHFGYITRIISLNLSKVYFIIAKCIMHAYNPHLLAYSFKRTDTLSLLSSDQLVFPEVHHERKPFFSRDEVYLAPAIFSVPRPDTHSY